MTTRNRELASIIDDSGNIIIDYVARYENIDDEFKFICNKIGLPGLELPHINYPGYYEDKPMPKREHYSVHYDDELIEIVRQRCLPDIERFDYEIEPINIPKKTKIFLNGNWIGFTKKPELLVSALKIFRR